jgi:hypothetical protein
MLFGARMILLKIKSFIINATIPKAKIAPVDRIKVHLSTSRCPKKDMSFFGLLIYNFYDYKNKEYDFVIGNVCEVFVK